MKFQKTIELWDIVDQLRDGSIKLQRGQWVTCGGLPRSRYMGVNMKSGTIECAHGGDSAEVCKRFKTVVQIKRDTVARFGRE